MTEETKKLIDEMDYESMLRGWRRAPAGSPLFQGATSDYFAKVMAEKRKKIGNAAHVTASKNIGWVILLFALLLVGCATKPQRTLLLDLTQGKLESTAIATETSIGSLTYHEVTDPNGVSTIHIKVESYKVAADRLAMERDKALFMAGLKAAGVVGAAVTTGVITP